MTVILRMKWNKEEHIYRHAKAVHQTDTDVFILLENDIDITEKTADLNYILVLSE